MRLCRTFAGAALQSIDALMRVFPWDDPCDLDYYQRGLLGEFGAQERDLVLNGSNLLLMAALVLPL